MHRLRTPGLVLGASLLFAAWWIGARGGPERVAVALAAPPAATQDVATPAVHAAAYLARATGPEGRVRYLADPGGWAPPAPDYNWVRHAGVLWALGSYHQARPDPRLLAAIQRQALALQREVVGRVPGQPGLLAVWTREPDLPLIAELGASGLGLAGLSRLCLASPGAVKPEVLQGLARFVRFLQDADGGFVHYYLPDRGGKDRSVFVPFYPGEAILGLTLCYRVDFDTAWLEGAARGMAHLIKTRDRTQTVQRDHWALIAAAELLPLYDRLKAPPVSRQQVVRHVALTSAAMLRGAGRHTDGPLRGCFTQRGETTPTACALEGLLCALTVLPEQGYAKLRARIVDAAAAGIGFLQRTQRRGGALDGGIPFAARRLPYDHKPATATFNREAGQVRMDVVQHALHAFQRWEQRTSR